MQRSGWTTPAESLRVGEVIRAAVVGSFLLTGLVGCAPVIFDETVDGMDLVRDLDDIFSISFPLGQEATSDSSLRAPEIRGTSVRLLSKERNDVQRRSYYKFEAVGLGEAEILWWKPERGTGRLVRDHCVRVYVRRWDW